MHTEGLTPGVRGTGEVGDMSCAGRMHTEGLTPGVRGTGEVGDKTKPGARDACARFTFDC